MINLKFLGEEFLVTVENLNFSSKQGFGISENADTQQTNSLNIFSNEEGFSNLKPYWKQIKNIDVTKVASIEIYEDDILIFGLNEIKIFDMNYSINIYNNSSSSNQREVIQITYK